MALGNSNSETKISFLFLIAANRSSFKYLTASEFYDTIPRFSIRYVSWDNSAGEVHLFAGDFAFSCKHIFVFGFENFTYYIII